MAEDLTKKQQADKDRAVADLCSALSSGSPVDRALRSCCYRHIHFVSVLFCLAVRDRFGMAGDIRDVTAFAARTKAARAPQDSFPSREAEAVIRAGLGESDFVRHVNPDEISYPEIAISVLTQLFAEWKPGREEVESLFERAEGVLAKQLARTPELATAEERWFAAGMPQSPFATLWDEQ